MINALPGYAQQTGVETFPSQPEQNTLYFPIIKRNTTLYVETFEVTQATQNFTTPVVLVANRPTAVRVFGRTYNTAQENGITAKLSAYRNSNLIGQLTVNGGTTYPASVSRDTLRADGSKTFNFQIPSNWITAGAITIVANLSTPDGILVSQDFSKSLTFSSVPQLNVKAVPIYLNNKYAPADTSYLTNALFKMYPVPSVNVATHPSYPFSGNLNRDNTWDTLLYDIRDLRDLEVGPGSATVYYGVIPLRDSNGYTWFDGSGTVGYGFVGDRVSIGVSDETFKITGYPGTYYLYGGDTAAHEIGHNLDRLHTPGCGAGNTDPKYPYANGIIGQYGYQYSNQSVIPYTYNDIMNYCENQWVSDYTYKGLYDNQMLFASAAAAAEQDILLIRAIPGADGSLALQPVYHFATTVSRVPESSDYSIQLLDESGQIIEESPVRLFTAQEKDASTSAIDFAIPDPGKPIGSIRLLHNGQQISAHTIENRLNDQVISAPAVSKEIDRLLLNWGANGTPAAVRFTTDGGLTWTALGMDIMEGQISIALSDLPSGTLQFQILLADNGDNLSVEYGN